MAAPTDRRPLSERLVERASGALDRRTDRRSVLQAAAVVGSALATGGVGYILRPGTAYASVCGEGASCTSGWTAFCCTVHGANTCPPYSFAAGWWKIDASPFCSGQARYIVDCNATCPTQCSCRCASGTCDERRVCCNQFRYGQCNTQIACYGPVVCRIALCTPPWIWSSRCTTTSRTDNRTITHNAPCLAVVPPQPPPPPCPPAVPGTVTPSDPILRTPPGQATYVPLTPARLMDTRPGGPTVDGQAAGGGAVGGCATRSFIVAGRGGVPASGVATVVLNVTVTGPTADGFLTVFPTGESRPPTSNLNFRPGQTVANAVISRVGADGQVTIHNDAGLTQLIVDVAGWVPTGSAYNPLGAARLLDTRPASTVDGRFVGGGAVGPGSTITVPVTGRGGVPASGVGAVVLNLTATGPTAGGFLTVFPAGEGQPGTSTLNFGPGQTVANLVIAKVGAGGSVSIANFAGSTHVIADVAGWFPAGSDYHALTPARLLDTRPGRPTADGLAAGAGPVGPGAVRMLSVRGRGGVPASGAGAVVLNITATGSTTGGYLTVFPAGEAVPLASSLNFGPDQTVANLVIAKLGTDGGVSILNAAGSTHVIADVAGWLPAGPA